MHHSIENVALTMRWTLETDASGHTHPVAHWVPAGPVEIAAHATIVQAA